MVPKNRETGGSQNRGRETGWSDCINYKYLQSSIERYLIGHNYHGHYFHAEDLSVNNYVREYIVRGIKARE